MTPDDLIKACRSAGIVLCAEGDRLVYDAPKGAMTPQLREALSAHKSSILAALRPQFVTLACGVTVPVAALHLAIDLEARGFALDLDGERRLIVRRADRLSESDRAALRRWHLHVAAIVEHARCAVTQ